MDRDSEDRFDEEIVALIQAGDERAFADLVTGWSPRVFGIAVGMLRNEEDARDVVQETFLNVHRRIGTFRGEAPIGSWICRIATNNALMKLRRRRRKPETSIEVAGPRFGDGGNHALEIVDWSPLADKLKEDRELGVQIRSAIAQLPESYRSVLVLADFQHLTMKEIGEQLDLTVPNVKTRLHRARLAVRDRLAKYLGGDM